MMHFMLLFSRQGKLRLQKWYVAHPDKVKKKNYQRTYNYNPSQKAQNV